MPVEHSTAPALRQSSAGLGVRLSLFMVGVLTVMTALMFAIVANIFGRTLPAIDADLVWKTQRGAAELARATDFGMVTGNRELLLEEMGDYRQSEDVLAIVVAAADGTVLAVHGTAPAFDLFAGPPNEVHRTSAFYTAHAPGEIEGTHVGDVAVVVSTARLREVDALESQALALVLVGSLAGLAGSLVFVRFYLAPVLALTERMLEQLAALNADLERRVTQRTVALADSNDQLRASLQTVNQMQKQLVIASHQAGRAEVATSVLHNVGNALNSVNVSSSVVTQTLRRSKLADLNRAVAMVNENSERLGTFLTEDRRGRAIPGFLTAVCATIGNEHGSVVEEMRQLQEHIDHIKLIVATQLDHARAHTGAIQRVAVSGVVEDAVKLNQLGFDTHRIALVCEHAELPEVFVDTNALLQILMNLLSNARHAVCDEGIAVRRVVVRTLQPEPGRLAIEVEDTGCGIPAENLTRIFNQGFTTKPDGHGFGLHGSANAAGTMGGALRVYSEGLGHGARFRLELPLRVSLDALEQPSHAADART